MEIRKQAKDLFQLATLLIWIDVASEFGIQYELTKDGSTWIAKPKDETMAKARQFGSATLGIAPDFWYTKARQKFYRKVKQRKVVEDALERAARQIG